MKMSVGDRLRRRQMEVSLKEPQGDESQTDSQSTSLARVDADHIKRLKGVVYVLENFIRNNDNGMYGRMAFFMSTVTDELAEELSELDEHQVKFFMFQIGEVISWIGHGDNSRLPEGVKEFADLVNPNGNDAAGTDTHLGIDSQSG